MATPNFSEEEIQFRRRARRRLVGAVVLVVIVVAVVPMILPEDRPKEAAQQIEIRIPSPDASGYAPRIQAVEPAASAAAAPPVPPAAPGAGESKAAVPPAPPEAPAVQPVEKATAQTQVFYVQFGAFSNGRNAQQKQAELKAKGIEAFTEVVKTSAGERIRVRSGPYETRDAAERVREQAKPLESKLVSPGP